MYTPGDTLLVRAPITDEWLAQASPQEIEAHVRTIIDDVIDGIVVYADTAKVLEFKCAAARVFGFFAGAINDQHISTIIIDFLQALKDSNPIVSLTSYEYRVIDSTRERNG